jgi:hypothetical protein
MATERYILHSGVNATLTFVTVVTLAPDTPIILHTRKNYGLDLSLAPTLILQSGTPKFGLPLSMHPASAASRWLSHPPLV